MKYISTRSAACDLSFEETLLSGMAADGGLYLPQTWPSLAPDALASLKDLHYSHIAAYILKKFSAKSIPSDDLAQIVQKTYNSQVFDHPDIAPLVQISDDLWIMELFHGPTLAFKDYALQLLGNLFDYVLEKNGEKITIVGATSGDTGSAAIEACRHCKNINIFILHPKGRTSDVQRKQMTTINAPNVKNIALDGTFDDCQAIVKAMFADESFREDVNLSAVNSINWARICAQIAYYVAAALKFDTPVNFSVPTGNFGNVFAAHCARKIGTPIDELIIGTNENDIVTRFFESGIMKKGDVTSTISPSMDIQISSNFERYLYELVGEDPGILTGLMKTFAQMGRLSVNEDRLLQAKKDFKAQRSGEANTLKTITNVYKDSGYVLDPHSAVGVYAAQQSRKHQGIRGPIISLACAHPAKFPDAVEKAIGKPPDVPDRLAAVMDKPEFVMPMPNDLARVKSFVKDNI